MQQEHPPGSKIESKIMALPWLIIWVAALTTLGKKQADIPFEYPLAFLLAFASPWMAWKLFRR
jgi:hypothetical protein